MEILHASLARLPQRAALRRALVHASKHTLRASAFSTQSSVYTWGTGTQGQLAHGPVVKSGVRNAYEQLTPKLVDALEGHGIRQLAFGATHSAAIDDQGRLYTWGSNEFSKLGLETETTEEALPQVVTAFDGIKVKHVSCGAHTTIAVDVDGKMYSWGRGGTAMKGAGGLGHAGGENEPTPRLLTTLVDQGVPIAKAECGEFHTVALTTDGELWAWGNGEYGRLGNGETVTYEVPEPVEFFAKDNIKDIAVGRDFSFALTEKGELFAWGGNSHNQLGVGGTLSMDFYNIEAIPVPLEFFRRNPVVQVAAGYNHAAAVTADGRVYMWGAKLWLEPREVTTLKEHHIVQVDCGRYYTIALSESGEIFTWGRGTSNCLGLDDRKNQLQPVPVESLRDRKVVAVAAGSYHAGAITEPHGCAADRDYSLRT